jgi:cytochrome c551/c552
MKLVVTIAAAGLLGMGAAQAEDAQVLLHRYSCYTCHADDEPGAGPAFADIARQYKGDRNAARKLEAVLRKGHAGWPWHMPPTTQISDAEARRMVRYILSTKPSLATAQ